jgi:hypothetical protein
MMVQASRVDVNSDQTEFTSTLTELRMPGLPAVGIPAFTRVRNAGGCRRLAFPPAKRENGGRRKQGGQKPYIYQSGQQPGYAPPQYPRYLQATYRRPTCYVPHQARSRGGSVGRACGSSHFFSEDSPRCTARTAALHVPAGAAGRIRPFAVSAARAGARSAA